MKADERDKIIADLMKMLQVMDNADPITSTLKLLRELEIFVDKVAGIGQKEGFAEGYKEAKRKLEKEQSKLN